MTTKQHLLIVKGTWWKDKSVKSLNLAVAHLDEKDRTG